MNYELILYIYVVYFNHRSGIKIVSHEHIMIHDQNHDHFNYINKIIIYYVFLLFYNKLYLAYENFVIKPI